MTNEQNYKTAEERIKAFGEFCERAKEASKKHDEKIVRLRREVAELKRRLKVAEDALKLCIRGMCGECSRQHPGETCVNGCYEMTAAKNALAAIREEGGAK